MTFPVTLRCMGPDMDIESTVPAKAPRQLLTSGDSDLCMTFCTLIRVLMLTSLAWLIFFCVACGQIAYEQAEDAVAPDADCVSTSQVHQDKLLRNVSAEEATSGCREFSASGCTECCSPTTTWSGGVDCLALGPTGERLTGSPCEPSCPSCAKCRVEDETALYDLANSLKCDCSVLDGKLGFDPDVACERDCYRLRSAALSCPHKVCLN